MLSKNKLCPWSSSGILHQSKGTDRLHGETERAVSSVFFQLFCDSDLKLLDLQI